MLNKKQNASDGLCVCVYVCLKTNEPESEPANAYHIRYDSLFDDKLIRIEFRIMTVL